MQKLLFSLCLLEEIWRTSSGQRLNRNKYGKCADLDFINCAEIKNAWHSSFVDCRAHVFPTDGFVCRSNELGTIQLVH